MPCKIFIWSRWTFWDQPQPFNSSSFGVILKKTKPRLLFHAPKFLICQRTTVSILFYSHASYSSGPAESFETKRNPLAEIVSELCRKNVKKPRFYFDRPENVWHKMDLFKCFSAYSRRSHTMEPFQSIPRWHVHITKWQTYHSRHFQRPGSASDVATSINHFHCVYR